MRLWRLIGDALAGWRLIVTGQAGWQERFALSAAGLTTAAALLVLAAFLAVARASTAIGMPSLTGVVVAILVLVLPALSLVGTTLFTRAISGSHTPLLPLLVPGFYLIIAFVVVEGVLAIFGPVVMLSWLALVYLLHRLARMASDWSRVMSWGFAVLTLVLLVALRLALYMLSQAGPAG